MHSVALAGDREEYILNGDRVISSYPKNFSYGGVIFEYTGTNAAREKVSTLFAMPLQRDLFVEVWMCPVKSWNFLNSIKRYVLLFFLDFINRQ